MKVGNPNGTDKKVYKEGEKSGETIQESAFKGGTSMEKSQKAIQSAP